MDREWTFKLTVKAWDQMSAEQVINTIKWGLSHSRATFVKITPEGNMTKYKLTFYRTSYECAEKIVEANDEEQAGEIATKMLDSIGEIDWVVSESNSEFDVNENFLEDSDGA